MQCLAIEHILLNSLDEVAGISNLYRNLPVYIPNQTLPKERKSTAAPRHPWPPWGRSQETTPLTPNFLQITNKRSVKKLINDIKFNTVSNKWNVERRQKARIGRDTGVPSYPPNEHNMYIGTFFHRHWVVFTKKNIIRLRLIHFQIFFAAKFLRLYD